MEARRGGHCLVNVPLFCQLPLPAIAQGIYVSTRTQGTETWELCSGVATSNKAQPPASPKAG